MTKPRKGVHPEDPGLLGSRREEEEEEVEDEASEEVEGEGEEEEDDEDEGGEGRLFLDRFDSPEDLEAHARSTEAELDRVRSEGAENRRLLDLLISQGVSVQGRKRGEDDQDLPAAPNPVDDPAGFARWMGERDARFTREFERARERDRAESRREREVDRLWDEFRAEYPELAAAPEVAQVAFDHEVKRYGGRMPPADTLKKNVARTMRDIQKRLGGGEKPAPNRTGGLKRGSAKRAKRVKKAKTETSGICNELERLQEDSGFF